MMAHLLVKFIFIVQKYQQQQQQLNKMQFHKQKISS
jgi:hypothetical protein